MKKLSLFSGIGGIDLAAKWAGMETVAFCEREEFTQKVLQKNFPGVPIYDDVCILTKERLEQDGIGTIDLISGGYPCQPFSLAGKRKGADDERYLWGEFFRLVQEIRPTWVLGENVYGHVHNGLDVVIGDLESEGYEVWAVVLQASDVGAPHKRERIFVVAFNADSKSSLQEDTFAYAERISRDTWQSITWKHWREVSELHREVPEPGICRMDDGISAKLDKSRLIALGNAVVPQQIYPILATIKAVNESL